MEGKLITDQFGTNPHYFEPAHMLMFEQRGIGTTNNALLNVI